MGAAVGELAVPKASNIASSPVFVNARQISDFAHGGQILVSNAAYAVCQNRLPDGTDVAPVGNVTSVDADEAEGRGGGSSLAAVQVLPGS
jgi:hypothetical protein